MTELKKALDVFKGSINIGTDDTGFISFNGQTKKSIIRALKIADKFMSEPSKKMVNKGAFINYEDIPTECKAACEIFKAMREQLLKEVDDEN